MASKKTSDSEPVDAGTDGAPARDRERKPSESVGRHAAAKKAREIKYDNDALVDFGIACLKIFQREVTFVQVGANDGQHGDPLHRHVKRDGWRGYLFEPVPLYFAQLVANYESCPGIECFNFAVSSSSGHQKIYYLDPAKADAAPRWARAIASFNKEHLTKHLAEDLILEESVRCLPFEDFAREQGIGDVDLIVIDVEGHEGAVLSTFDLARINPKLVILEHIHTPEADLAGIEKALEEAGLVIIKGYKDMIALRPEMLDVSRIRQRIGS